MQTANATRPAAASTPEFSIVIPVYNEAENVPTLLREIERHVRGDYEILIVYDFDEDATLPAIAAMEPPVGRVRLVRNTIGRGVVNALRSGFQQSEGWLGVVVTMGDLSDPPEHIDSLVEKLREGCDVVAGSRYMPGGKMIGGPWLKRNLSRLAGVGARWLTGIGIHDVTTNFRAYSRRMTRTRIESRGGFELGLELTTKCHLAGWKVGQVPAAWYDRTAGESRFRLWSWLPGYLRWYLKLLAGDPLGLGSLWRRRRTALSPCNYGYFGVYERPGYGWIAARPGAGVVAVPRTRDNRIVMIRLQRPYHRADQSAWELPGGGQESGESIVDTAAREMFEETGFRSDLPGRPLPTDLQPAPGMMHFSHRIVFFDDCYPVEDAQIDKQEGIQQVETFEWEHVDRMLASGEITALPTIAALHMAKLNEQGE